MGGGDAYGIVYMLAVRRKNKTVHALRTPPRVRIDIIAIGDDNGDKKNNDNNSDTSTSRKTTTADDDYNKH